MLDVVLRGVSFRYPSSSFALEDISVTFTASTHTAICGLASCGASTLLRLVAGHLVPAAGEVILGTRVVNDVKASRRPLLYATGAVDVPLRWSVEHALVNAVRSRSLDRIDRRHELSLAASKWELEPLLRRRIDTLSGSEQLRVKLARIELLKPAILVADRILEGAAASARRPVADAFYRTLRILGTTVISAVSDVAELGFTDKVAVLDAGRIVQQGTAAAVFTRPASEAAAAGTGEVNVVELTIRGTSVSSSIGEWELAEPPFQGGGIALARPEEFHVARAGEESDLIFGIEEASFEHGRWLARGLLTGGFALRVALPGGTRIEKGRLLPLRYDPARFTLVPRSSVAPAERMRADVIPRRENTR